jgi:hypothetical protein
MSNSFAAAARLIGDPVYSLKMDARKHRVKASNSVFSHHFP